MNGHGEFVVQFRWVLICICIFHGLLSPKQLYGPVETCEQLGSDLTGPLLRIQVAVDGVKPAQQQREI